MSLTTENNSVNGRDSVVVAPPQYKYAVLQEMSGEQMEAWLYFIRVQGNEKALNHLQKQLETVDWYVLDDLSTFDLELTNPVSEITAKEMTKIDLNAHSFHRKFDGKLEMIDLKLKESYSNDKKMKKIYSILGDGKIEDFVDEEDLVGIELDGTSESESESDATSEETSDSDSESGTGPSKAVGPSGSDTSSKKKGKVPSVAKIPLPGFAKAKAKRNKKNKKTEKPEN